jgi:hypothetical protein
MGKMSMEVIKAQVGYIDRIGDLVKKEGLTMDDFQYMIMKRVDALTDEEKVHLANIRNALPRPDANTIMQKVLKETDYRIYMNDGYGGSVQGFVTMAADTKQFNTASDYYNGLRLDYKGQMAAESYPVLRFKSKRASEAIIPRDSELGTNEYPFTGTGFTSGKKEHLGVPEWKLKPSNPKEPIDMEEGAEIWRVYNDGTEKLIARYGKDKNGVLKFNRVE